MGKTVSCPLGELKNIPPQDQHALTEQIISRPGTHEAIKCS